MAFQVKMFILRVIRISKNKFYHTSLTADAIIIHEIFQQDKTINTLSSLLKTAKAHELLLQQLPKLVNQGLCFACYEQLSE